MDEEKDKIAQKILITSSVKCILSYLYHLSKQGFGLMLSVNIVINGN